MAVYPSATPFTLNETRPISVDRARIDQRFLEADQAPAVSAQQIDREIHSWGQARHYALLCQKAGLDGRAMINGSEVDVGQDEPLLGEMAEQALAPIPEPLAAGLVEKQ